jgi:hypothetical protein
MIILTSCRKMVWTALDDYAPLDGKLISTLRYDEDGGRVIPSTPPYAKMPCLKIWPGQIGNGWFVNSAQKFDYPLAFTLWTPGHVPDAGEEILQRVIEGIYQGLQGNNEAIQLKEMSFAPPLQLFGDTGKTCIRWEWMQVFGCRLWNPRATN